MQIAIVTDVHGNRPAFEAVIAAAEEAGRRRDVVPRRPRRLRRRAGRLRRARRAPLRGLPVAATTTSASSASCRSRTSAAARASPPSGRAETITEDTREFLLALTPERRGPRLRPLPRLPARPDLGVRPLRPDRRAVLRRRRTSASPSSATRTWPCPSTARRASRPTGSTRREGDELDLSEGEWLLNPGGAGQPRDGDPRAAWLLLDTDAQTSPAGAARSTTLPLHRTRFGPPGCRTRWPSGCSTDSDLRARWGS